MIRSSHLCPLLRYYIIVKCWVSQIIGISVADRHGRRITNYFNLSANRPTLIHFNPSRTGSAMNFQK